MLALLFYTFPFPLAQVSILVLQVRAPEFSFAVRLLRFPFHFVTIGFCFCELLRMGLTVYPAQTNVEPTGSLDWTFCLRAAYIPFVPYSYSLTEKKNSLTQKSKSFSSTFLHGWNSTKLGLHENDDGAKY